MQVSVPNHELARGLFQGDAGEFLNAAKVLVLIAEAQSLDVVPVVDAVPDPGRYFAVIQY